MKFKEWKKDRLKKLDKEGADKKIVPLLKIINSKSNYCTTSSCSGRIVLSSGDKKEHNFIHKSHLKVNSKKIWDTLKNDKTRDVWFRYEGIILHVGCKDFLSAKKLLELARGSGYKRSGIISSKNVFMVEVYSTQKIETPLKKEKLLIDFKFLDYICLIANKMLEKEHKKISKLNHIFLQHL
jgi:tRNA wybutosine-synthesizing protein 3